MSSFVLLIFLAVVIPATLKHPFAGVLGWFWFSFLNPHQMIWGPVADLPIAAIIAATTLVSLFLNKERKRLPNNLTAYLIVAMGAVITWSTVNAHLPALAWPKWEEAIKILLMTVVAAMLLNTRERLHAVVVVTVFAMGFFGVRGGLFTLATGGQYHVFGPPGTFIADNNQLALALIMTVPLIRYVQLQSASPWMRRAMGVALVLTAVSIIGSQSRGAFLAICAIIPFLILKSRNRLPLMGLAVALGVGLLAFAPQRWVERMETLKNYEEDASAMSRLRTWGWAIDLAKQDPLSGGGFRVERDEELYLSMVEGAKASYNFHSIYFEMLGHHGFLGLAVFLLLLATSWRNFAVVLKRARGSPSLFWARDLAAMGQVSLIGYMVAGAFLNLAFFDLSYLVFTLSACVRGVVQRAETPEAARRRGRTLARPDRARAALSLSAVERAP